MLKKYFMRKLPILLLLLPLFFVGCKSNEEKVAELIKNELSKTLYDFESYSPIETVVTEAKRSVYTDTALWAKAEKMCELFWKGHNIIIEAAAAQEKMEIWGPPTSYSSSYSDAKYFQYRKECISKYEESMKYRELVLDMSKTLKDTLQAIDSAKVVGWEVTHRFRCKTKGGLSDIGDYRYVIDKEFKKILICEDRDEEQYKKIRDFIDVVVMKGALENM